MAKITDFKIEIKGEKFVVPVSCSSAGQFKARIPEKVASALNLNGNIGATSLPELSNKFYEAINRYKNAETTEELFIVITYGACGEYVWRTDKKSVLFGNNTEYKLDVRHNHNFTSAIAFDFAVFIKETIDGSVTWHETRQGKETAHWDEKQNEPEKYFKTTHIYGNPHGKIIPFSETSIATLTMARNKLLGISNMLFEFIDRDPIAIADTLTKTKLLS